MSVYEGMSEEKFSRKSRRGYCQGRRWKPLELGAMIAGFIVYWPIGAGILFLKIWQRSEQHPGDLVSFTQEKMANMQNLWKGASRRATNWAPTEWKNGFSAAGFGGSAFGMASTGNSAFDDWRASELRRLEEERLKLVAAERDFAEHLDRLRRARDRHEFEQFMAERNAQQAKSGPTA